MNNERPISPEVSSVTQKTQLSQLLGEPGKLIPVDNPAYQLMDGFLAATSAHMISLPKLCVESYLDTMNEEERSSFLVNLKKHLESVEQFLTEQLQNYDPDFLEEINTKMSRPYDGLAVKLIKKKLKKGDLLGAHEAFWGSWNAPFRVPIKMFYRGAGGDEKPFFASVAAMAYSGFLHVVDPYSGIPMSVLCASLLGKPFFEYWVSMIVHATALFTALGIPIGISKRHRLKKRSNHEETSGVE
jgi:hypothetical protein